MFFKTYSTGMKEEMQGQPSHESIHSNMREKKLKKLHDYQTSKNATRQHQRTQNEIMRFIFMKSHVV